MADFPALPLWTDAYLADTRHLTDAEHGRYLLLLMDMWRSPECRFPNDGEWLCRRFRRTPADFDSEIMPLLKEFCQCDGNWWTQKKLLKVWTVAKNQSRKQSGRAKSRWNKEKGLCPGNAGPMPPQAMPPSPSPIKKERKIPDASHPRRLTASPDAELPLVALDENQKAGGPLGAQQDLDALYYQRGKALLGQKAGGVLTKLRAAVGSVGAALQIIDDAQRKESPAEYVAGCIRNKGNGFARPGNRAGISGILRELDERDEDREARARGGPHQVRREGHDG